MEVAKYSPDNKTPSIIQISQWNGRSIQNEAKVNYVRGLPGDLIVLQEIWQQLALVRDAGTLLDSTERNDKRGGGLSDTS